MGYHYETWITHSDSRCHFSEKRDNQLRLLGQCRILAYLGFKNLQRGLHSPQRETSGKRDNQLRLPGQRRIIAYLGFRNSQEPALTQMKSIENGNEYIRADGFRNHP